MRNPKVLYGFLPEEISPPKEVWHHIEKALECGEHAKILRLSSHTPLPLSPLSKKKKTLKFFLITAVAASFVGIAIFAFCHINKLGGKMAATIPVVLQSVSKNDEKINHTALFRYQLAIGANGKWVKVSKKLENMIEFLSNSKSPAQTEEKRIWKQKLEDWKSTIMGTDTKPILTNFADPINLIHLSSIRN